MVGSNGHDSVKKRASVAGLCSIVLPTFNRAAFLPDAMAAIRSQRHANWELIVVDDGSTDGTRAVFTELARPIAQPTRYVYQANRGPGAARNRGIDFAVGEYVAFYDSDDLWLPHHLAACIGALRANSALTWVYGAMRRVEYSTNKVVQAHSFYDEAGRPKPFLRLRSRNLGALRFIDDPDACRCAILHGLQNGFPVSVVRRRLFDDGLRIPELDVGEDRCLSIQALKRGAVVAYFDDIHMIARIHTSHTSSAGQTKPLAQHLAVERQLIAAYESLAGSEAFDTRERRALRRKIAEERFWMLGYNLFWQHGRGGEALHEYQGALRMWHWNPWMWKTFLLAGLRLALHRAAPLR